jgi:hypothetical protein
MPGIGKCDATALEVSRVARRECRAERRWPGKLGDDIGVREQASGSDRSDCAVVTAGEFSHSNCLRGSEQGSKVGTQFSELLVQQSCFPSRR